MSRKGSVRKEFYFWFKGFGQCPHSPLHFPNSSLTFEILPGSCRYIRASAFIPSETLASEKNLTILPISIDPDRWRYYFQASNMPDVSLGRARRARIIRSAGNQCFASLIIPTLLGDFYLTSKKALRRQGRTHSKIII